MESVIPSWLVNIVHGGHGHVILTQLAMLMLSYSIFVRKEKYGRLLKRVFLMILYWNSWVKRAKQAKTTLTCYLRHFRLTGKQRPLPQLHPYLQLESPTRHLHTLLYKIWNVWEQKMWIQILPSQLECGWKDSISGEWKGRLLRSLKEFQKSVLMVSCSCSLQKSAKTMEQTMNRIA